MGRRRMHREQFDLFSDLSRCNESPILINDVALAIARGAATENLDGEDEDVAQEAREIVEWVDSVEEMCRVGVVPTLSHFKKKMTL